MHENRETSGAPRLSQSRGRSEKAQSRTSDMHAPEESDRIIVPMNQPNKEGQPSAEVGEGRVRAKENIAQSNTSPTQSGERVSQGLRGVREVAKARKQERFTALLHHLSIDLLRDSLKNSLVCSAGNRKVQPVGLRFVSWGIRSLMTETRAKRRLVQKAHRR